MASLAPEGRTGGRTSGGVRASSSSRRASGNSSISALTKESNSNSSDESKQSSGRSEHPHSGEFRCDVAGGDGDMPRHESLADRRGVKKGSEGGMQIAVADDGGSGQGHNGAHPGSTTTGGSTASGDGRTLLSATKQRRASVDSIEEFTFANQMVSPSLGVDSALRGDSGEFGGSAVSGITAEYSPQVSPASNGVVRTPSVKGFMRRTSAAEQLRTWTRVMEKHAPPMKDRVFMVLNGNPYRDDQNIAVCFHFISVALILVSVVVFCVESHPQYYKTPPPKTHPLFLTEAVCIAFFTVELLMKAMLAPSISMLLSFQTLVDVLSVIGFYIDLIIEAATESQSKVSGLVAIRLFRLTRVMRIFKLSRYSQGIAFMGQVVKASRAGLMLLILPIGLSIVIFSSVIFYLEQVDATFDKEKRRWMLSNGKESKFQSIPHTAWFITATLTTVGYGDVVPTTVAGRIMSVFVIFFGMLVLSFPTIVMSANFQTLHRRMLRRRARQNLGRMFRKLNAVTTFIGRLQRSLANTKAKEKRRAYHVERKKRLRRERYFLTDADVSEAMASNAKIASLHPITEGNIYSWSFCNLPALRVVQKTLEVFSCVARPEELLDRGRLGADCNQETLEVVINYLLSGGFLSVFVYGAGKNVVMLTPRSLQAVYVLTEEAEDRVVPLERTLQESRALWENITRHPFALEVDLQNLAGAFPRWCAEQQKAMAGEDSSPDGVRGERQFDNEVSQQEAALRTLKQMLPSKEPLPSVPEAVQHRSSDSSETGTRTPKPPSQPSTTHQKREHPSIIIEGNSSFLAVGSRSASVSPGGGSLNVSSSNLDVSAQRSPNVSPMASLMSDGSRSSAAHYTPQQRRHIIAFNAVRHAHTQRLEEQLLTLKKLKAALA